MKQMPDDIPLKGAGGWKKGWSLRSPPTQSIPWLSGEINPELVDAEAACKIELPLRVFVSWACSVSFKPKYFTGTAELAQELLELSPVAGGDSGIFIFIGKGNTSILFAHGSLQRLLRALKNCHKGIICQCWQQSFWSLVLSQRTLCSDETPDTLMGKLELLQQRG